MGGSGRAGEPPQEHRGGARHEGVVRLQGSLQEVRGSHRCHQNVKDLNHEMANLDLQVEVEGDYLGLLLALGDDEHHGGGVVHVQGLIGRANDGRTENWRVARETQGTDAVFPYGK